ncbi:MULTISPECIES: anti-sigma factor family protein [Sphingomonas]|uniref:anti-sigma factor family protein n=1 Tax=Sphingomonas TaxID=13687 RepID=UPI000DEFFE8B|nr:MULTISPECIES: anti-sigma factor [Sphingomonas]
MNDETEFFAWLDGELAPADAARVAARVAADPALQAQADAHRALTAQVRNAFAPVAEAPLPPQLLAALNPNVSDLAAVREQRQRPRWLGTATAMAASLTLGLLVGGRLIAPAAGPIATDHGQIVAAGALADGLSQKLASADLHDGVQPVLTFRDKAGALCRTFRDAGHDGLACRDGDRWRVDALLRGGGEDKGGDYRMASGGNPQLMDMVSERMAGEPLDAAGEREALAKLR